MSAISPRDVMVEARGIAFHLRVWSDEGHPVLLLHGLASSAQTWNLVARLLASKFRVVAVDERGHGQTEKPDSGYDLSTFVQDVHGIVEALDLTGVALVGQSWGGHVALKYAVTYPEMISHLVLVDGGFSDMQTREEATWENVEKNMTPPDLRMPLPAFVERLRSRLGSAYSNEVRDAVLGNVWVDERGVVHPNLTRERHMLLARAIWEHRSSLEFARVQCPTLVIPAEPPGVPTDPDRQRWRRQAVALAEQRLPRGRILWMRDTLHDVQLHRPAELATAITQFIRES